MKHTVTGDWLGRHVGYDREGIWFLNHNRMLLEQMRTEGDPSSGDGIADETTRDEGRSAIPQCVCQVSVFIQCVVYCGDTGKQASAPGAERRAERVSTELAREDWEWQFYEGFCGE